MFVQRWSISHGLMHNIAKRSNYHEWMWSWCFHLAWLQWRISCGTAHQLSGLLPNYQKRWRCVPVIMNHILFTLTMGCDPLLRSSWHPASEDNFLTSVFKLSRQGSGCSILLHYSNFILCSCKIGELCICKQNYYVLNRRGIRLKLIPLWTNSTDVVCRGIVNPNMWYVCLQYTPNKAHILFLFSSKEWIAKRWQINATSL